jgi:hypothetical protein
MNDHYPASQSFPAPSHANASSGPGSASITSSSGDVQVPAQRVAMAEHVVGHGLPASSDGQHQFLNVAVKTNAQSTHLGHTTNISAGSASQVRAPGPVDAEQLPGLAEQVQGGSGRPGGLPTNVMIR